MGDAVTGFGPSASSVLQSDGFSEVRFGTGFAGAADEAEPEHAMVAAFELLRIPAAAIREDRRIMAANGPMRALPVSVASTRNGRMALACRTADGLLARALASAKRSGSEAVAHIPLKAGAVSSAMVAHLMPAPLTRGSCRFILAITPVTRLRPPAPELLEAMFDLTPCEARVAREIAAGNTVEEIATLYRVSSGTVRAQLKAVFGKTKTRRQSDLLALVCSLEPFRF